MKALTIHQPWAALIAIGAKRYETRSWTCKYCGPIAIHAGRNRDGVGWMTDGASEGSRAAVTTLQAAGISIPDLAFGSIIAIGDLVGQYRTEDIRRHSESPDVELLFGNYGDNRFGWEIVNVIRLPEPIAAQGAQGLWEWQPPRHLDINALVKGKGS